MEAIKVHGVGVHGVVGPEGGAQGQFVIKLPKIQRHQAGAALHPAQIAGVVPQGDVRFAVLRVLFKAVSASRQGVQAEILPQAVAVIIGLVRE
jgi:hypothetical protein